MDAIDYVKAAYKVSKCARCCAMSCFGSCCCKKRQAELKKLHLFKKWLSVDEACEPDNIKWENLGHTAKSRNFRICFTWFIALVLILISLGGIVLFKDISSDLKKEYNTDSTICPGSSTKD